MEMGEVIGTYLNSEETCKYLNKSIATLYRFLRMRNGIPAHRIGGRWLFIRGEVDDWIKRR
jgi:excisionase family DNA binding protein